jgi:GAF domain-containing protein
MFDNEKLEAEELISGERNMIANAANIAALIFNSWANVNWAGFYFLSGEELVLGPFQGKPACIRIPLGKGVCGTSAKMRHTIIVDDVETFPGHISCDARSASEMVVPLIADGELFGVIDLDSPIRKRFGQFEQEQIESIVQILIAQSDVSSLENYY